MRICAALASLLGCVSLLAQEPASFVLSLQRAYLNRELFTGVPSGLQPAEAMRAQSEFVQLLTPQLGPPAGYKVGVVTKAGQERLGLKGPLRGVLLEKMLLTNGITVPLSYAARPIVEPDLLVRVKDEQINEARTPAEALASLSEVIAFIELADGIMPAAPPADAGAIIAMNVGARAGVLGQKLKVDNTPQFLQALGQMELVMLDGAGQELSRSTAKDIMGHPLNALLWLVSDLSRNGRKLKAGDLVSLGSPSPQITPRPGDQFRLVYKGLPGGEIQVEVKFSR